MKNARGYADSVGPSESERIAPSPPPLRGKRTGIAPRRIRRCTPPRAAQLARPLRPVRVPPGHPALHRADCAVEYVFSARRVTESRLPQDLHVIRSAAAD